MCNVLNFPHNSFVLVSWLLYLFTTVLYDKHDYVITFVSHVFCFNLMVLMVLLGLNGQNNEGRSQFDNGSTNGENGRPNG